MAQDGRASADLHICGQIGVQDVDIDISLEFLLVQSNGLSNSVLFYKIKVSSSFLEWNSFLLESK